MARRCCPASVMYRPNPILLAKRFMGGITPQHSMVMRLTMLAMNDELLSVKLCLRESPRIFWPNFSMTLACFLVYVDGHAWLQRCSRRATGADDAWYNTMVRHK